MYDNTQVTREVLRAPVLDYEREKRKDWDGKHVVVEHAIPITKACRLDAFAHKQDLQGARSALTGMRTEADTSLYAHTPRSLGS